MIKLNEMLFKQRIEISPQIVCGINNVIILHINNAGTATQKQGLITFLSNSFILMIETFDAIHTRIVQTNISYHCYYQGIRIIGYYAGIVADRQN